MHPRDFARSLDHFVVPVDDIVIAEEFYVSVFGGVIRGAMDFVRETGPCRCCGA